MEFSIDRLYMRLVDAYGIRGSQVNLSGFLEEVILPGEISNLQIDIFNGRRNEAEGVKAVNIVFKVSCFCEGTKTAEKVIGAKQRGPLVFYRANYRIDFINNRGEFIDYKGDSYTD